MQIIEELFVTEDKVLTKVKTAESFYNLPQRGFSIDISNKKNIIITHPLGVQFKIDQENLLTLLETSNIVDSIFQKELAILSSKNSLKLIDTDSDEYKILFKKHKQEKTLIYLTENDISEGENVTVKFLNKEENLTYIGKVYFIPIRFNILSEFFKDNDSKNVYKLIFSETIQERYCFISDKKIILLSKFPTVIKNNGKNDELKTNTDYLQYVNLKLANNSLKKIMPIFSIDEYNIEKSFEIKYFSKDNSFVPLYLHNKKLTLVEMEKHFSKILDNKKVKIHFSDKTNNYTNNSNALFDRFIEEYKSRTLNFDDYETNSLNPFNGIESLEQLEEELETIVNKIYKLAFLERGAFKEGRFTNKIVSAIIDTYKLEGSSSNLKEFYYNLTRTTSIGNESEEFMFFTSSLMQYCKRNNSASYQTFYRLFNRNNIL